MGKATGFLEFTRELPKKRSVEERKNDYKEIEPLNPAQSQQQAARCMDCGIPFCHNGCPLGNIIPEFNDAVYEQNWEYAYQILSSTNNFPEFTGRICPAPCESSCVLGINKPPVAIEFIEKSIIEKAYELGYVKPKTPAKRTGKKVAIIGSGPAGLATAAQLNYAGHWVTVFERADQIGGLLRYGIPDFKLEKNVVTRRVEVMTQEGIEFKTNVNVGSDIKADALLEDFDAVVLAMGSTVPRNLPIPGRDLKGVYFAMEFLSQQNKRVSGIDVAIDHQGKAYKHGEILATNKNVMVLGGGDTGSDCVGTSNRHGAASITQIEIMPMPPKERAESTPWPHWPMMLRTSTSHEEGCERKWSVNTKAFLGDENGNLRALQMVELDWQKDPETGRMAMREVAGSEREIPCELALLAAGFLNPQHEGLLNDLGVEFEERTNNIKAINYQSTTNPKVFAAGDCRRGQSLVVWAISEGREAARKVDEFLMGESLLEAKELSMFTPSFAHV
ncbi:MAG: glutamate synthase subunit beta [Cytophagia bacterium]|jgi:glutamate synthase (NADPH) small chain|nr:MAG: glutamate synthase subunit beta [Runella sp.]TAG16207.1 MAG: glutamate synthase subunit beta [Cytophagales bacterium]TAG35471.1 MAG: glutamate synthase subunit beta [Cytophagia bacterium]TAG77330.1 MAG: glutamate synthase subunit beta [Cytophagales bacterium]